MTCVTAVRSCWAAAFAVDPLARLESCGLPLDALELGLLIQPELRPAAGGTAQGDAPHRATERSAGGGAAAPPDPVERRRLVDGVCGHPGALLAGWADGASAQVRLADPGREPNSGRLPVRRPGHWPELLGADLVAAVARLAAGVYWALGDTSIEWATDNGTVWLLQATPASPGPPLAPGRSQPAQGHPAVPAALRGAGAVPGPGGTTRRGKLMPLLAAAVQAAGRHLAGRPAAAGQAAGRLVPCRPHQRPAAHCRDAILLIDQPVPALAPLLFAARGVIARGGTASAHLAEVARSLAVPMVTGCRPEAGHRPGTSAGSTGSRRSTAAPERWRCSRPDREGGLT